LSEPIPDERLTIVPANEASWDDLAAIFGTTDYAGLCQCQRFKVVGWIWRDSTHEERTAMFRAQTAHGASAQTQLSRRRLGRLTGPQPQPHPVDRLRRQPLVIAMPHNNTPRPRIKSVAPR
jgi:hypothetical protein